MPLVDAGDLLVEVVLVEQRLAAFVELEPVDVARHDDLQELLGPLERLRLVDVDRVDVAGEDVADRADDHVAFFVDIHRAGGLLDAADDDFPEPQQVGEVARQFLLGAVGAGGADDEADALGRVELAEDVAEAAAVFVAFDLARDADAAERRHEHQVAAGDADVGGERRPFGADAFLDDLDEDFVAALEDVLDGRLEAWPDAGAEAGRFRAGAAAVVAPRTSLPRLPRGRRADLVVAVRRSGRVEIAIAALAAAGQDRFARIVSALAKVLRLDVADVQEAVAADAEIDERRLDAGLQVDDAALVDVADEILLARSARGTALRAVRLQRSRCGILPPARR